MKKSIDKIIEEVLASLAMENLSVSQDKINEVKNEHKKLVLRKDCNNDRIGQKME